MTELAKDSGGETAMDHIANAIQPLLILTQAPTFFTVDDMRESVAGAMARLERASALLAKSPEAEHHIPRPGTHYGHYGV